MGDDKMIPTADIHLLKHQRQFLYDVEQAIREANLAIIHTRIPKIGKATFVKMAKGVSLLRADYLEAALQLANEAKLSADQMADLKLRRERFEEARTAFDAVQRAIIRGYVDVAE